MPKALADVAPQELADYKGAWVEVPHKPYPVIFMGEFQSTGEIKYGAVIFDPRYGTNYERLDDCALRPDLARAWTPGGSPVSRNEDNRKADNNQALLQALDKIAAGVETMREEILKKLSAGQV